MKPAHKSKGGGLRAAFAFRTSARLAQSSRIGGLLPAGLFYWKDGAGFLAQMNPGYGSGPPGYRGRLVINYPVLCTVLLILAILAVLLVGYFLYYRFFRSEGSLETRVAELEKSIGALYRKQQEDLDGVLGLLHRSPSKASARSEEAPDQEKDTRVEKIKDKE